MVQTGGGSITPGILQTTTSNTTTTAEGKLNTDNSDVVKAVNNMTEQLKKQEMSPVGLYEVSRQ